MMNFTAMASSAFSAFGSWIGGKIGGFVQQNLLSWALSMLKAYAPLAITLLVWGAFTIWLAKSHKITLGVVYLTGIFGLLFVYGIL